MSLSLLLEKYDVSTEEGLQKALNEIEKEEVCVPPSDVDLTSFYGIFELIYVWFRSLR